MRAGVAVRVRCGLDTCEEYASVQLAVASWVEAARQHGALEYLHVARRDSWM
jgi:hypothetical protein